MIQQILAKMIEYDAKDAKRIQHFLKVYGFAHMIGELEGLNADELKILDIAAILHDIGIHLSEKKYGNCNGKHQEEIGPYEARKMLGEFDLSDEIIERVCFLIGHHHTYNQVDGLDYQVLLEADFLVNAYEDNMDKEAILSVREKVFRTKTGIETLNTMFGL